MKKQFILLLLLSVGWYSSFFAQTDQENLDKYWGYRDRLVRNFMKVGKEAGHSLPMAYPVLLTTAKDLPEESHSAAYMLFTLE
jgi:hypothetical protein